MKLVGLLFNVDGRPVPKGRPRFANGHAYTPDTTRDYERFVAQTAASTILEGAHDNKALPLFPTEQVSVTIGIHISGRSADLDNYAKSILDGLQGVAFANDAQVAELTIRRHKASRNEQYAHVSVRKASKL